MSSKLKFFSNSSTPAKLKQSVPDGSASVSPAKSNKYKTFLTSVFTPTQSKKWIQRKKSCKSEESHKAVKNETKEIYEDHQLSDDFNEPGYSSIPDLQLKHLYNGEPGIESVSVLSAQDSEHVQKSSQHYAVYINEEPIYATVNKQNQSVCEENEKMYDRNVVEDQKEEIKLLVERLKELTNENRELRKNIETLLKEEKWKEDSLHAELKLKISQLEVETHKEVSCLSEQIQTLQKERQVLVDQIDVLHQEKKSLLSKYNDICSRAKSMVSPQFLKKTAAEHQKLLKQLEKKHQDEVRNLQKENEVVLESKIYLTDEVENLKGKMKVLIIQNETLKSSEQELVQENNRILLQLEESKQMQQEAQNMLVALVKITESVSVERDILMNKASYQDHQQSLLKTGIMDYSLNMGRLQEHISNFSKEKLDQLHKLKTGEFARDESMKNFYGGQLELLRSKVLNQNSTINDLETEKSKLELQLGSLWQAACIGKPKLMEDIRYNMG